MLYSKDVPRSVYKINDTLRITLCVRHLKKPFCWIANPSTADFNFQNWTRWLTLSSSRAAAVGTPARPARKSVRTKELFSNTSRPNTFKLRVFLATFAVSSQRLDMLCQCTFTDSIRITRSIQFVSDFRIG